MKYKTFFFVASLFVFISLPAFANAATLSFSPASGALSVGDKVTVSVLVDSGGVPINNAEGVVSFPGNEFDVVSVNKDTSIFTLWINAPSYDGNNSISFNGGLPSPGYQGSNGNLFTVTLRAKAPGSGVFSILNGAVRANDGLGTNVLTGTGNANITVSSATAIPAQQTPQAAQQATTPTNVVVVSSPTDPSSDVWYNQNDALLQFSLPDGTASIETILAKSVSALPSISYKPAVSQKLITNIDDGTWYFNIRARVGNAWTPVTSYRLQIDTTPPAANASFGFDPTKQSLTLTAYSSDTVSGVASYDVLLDGATTTVLAAQDFNGSANIPLHVSPGQHAVTLRVFDRAGNSTDVSGVILVPAGQELTTRLLNWLASGTGTETLIISILVVSLLLLLMNIILWIKLTAHKRPGGKDIARVQASAKKKMLDFKKSISKEDAALEKIHAHKKLTTQEAETLKKIRTQLSETGRYMDEKIKDLK